MTEQQEDSLGQSPDTAALNREKLAELLPEAFSEGRLDVEALKRTLGEDSVIEDGERYRLEWAGKRDAYRVLQTPTTATLRPERDKSLNFDEAQHVFIEGENLEVLKVLQKSYFGKVKLIYIDPPYNTGNDSFIYPDRFQENKEDYLKRINELDDDGTLMREGFFRKNSRENGHYHSNWLNMMLPRLYIARNLLREDGVIFVSCDDNEVHNLRCMMNEIFGEENFVNAVIWQKVYSPKNSAKHFSEDHDYLLIYARNAADWRPNLLPRTEEMEARYDNPDDDPRGPWKPGDMSARNYYSEGNYAIKCPSGRKICGPPSGRYWVVSEKNFLELVRENRIWWGKEGNNVPAIKRFLSEVKQGRVPQTLWKYEEVGHTQDAKKELVSLVNFPNSDTVFDTPKPTKLIRQILRLSTFSDSADIVLDFFGGSATTLQAVLDQNVEDEGNRRCIVVQLPEATEQGGENLKTIADMARIRITKAIENLYTNADLATAVPDRLGFKNFRLSPSSFKQWRGDDIESVKQLAEQIRIFEKSDKEGAEVEAMLYELLLRFGEELTTEVESLEIEDQRVFAVRERKMLFLLDSFSEAMLEPLLEIEPDLIVALDSLFTGSDELKANLDLHCSDAGIRLTSV